VEEHTMQIRHATIDDIDLLIKLRVDYLLEENKLQELKDIEVIKGKLREYFEKWIPLKGFIAYIAEENGNVYSTAFLSIVERPPRTANTSYYIGTVYNVFTYPQYRRKGIATKVMGDLLADAESLSVASVDLLATEDGTPLYEKLGFTVPAYTPMRIKLNVRT